MARIRLRKSALKGKLGLSHLRASFPGTAIEFQSLALTGGALCFLVVLLSVLPGALAEQPAPTTCYHMRGVGKGGTATSRALRAADWPSG